MNYMNYELAYVIDYVYLPQTKSLNLNFGGKQGLHFYSAYIIDDVG